MDKLIADVAALAAPGSLFHFDFLHLDVLEGRSAAMGYENTAKACAGKHCLLHEFAWKSAHSCSILCTFCNALCVFLQFLHLVHFTSCTVSVHRLHSNPCNEVKVSSVCLQCIWTLKAHDIKHNKSFCFVLHKALQLIHKAFECCKKSSRKPLFGGGGDGQSVWA